MMESNYLKSIAEVVSEVKGIPFEQVKPESFIEADLGLDSIGVVDLWFELKQKISHKKDLKEFYDYVRGRPPRKSYNDFQIRELCEFLEKED